MSSANPMTPVTPEILSVTVGPLETQCYVVLAPTPAALPDGELQDPTSPSGEPALRSATVVDPGMGAREAVTKLAAQHRFQVTSVVLTHGHIDHFRDAHLFDVPVYLHPADEMMVRNPQLIGPQLAALFQVDTISPIADLRPLGQAIDMGEVQWEVHHMPGHSPGSVMLRSGPSTAAANAPAGAESELQDGSTAVGDGSASDSPSASPSASPSDGAQASRAHGDGTTAAATGPRNTARIILGGDVLFAGGIGRTDLPLSDSQAMLHSLRQIPRVFDAEDTVLPGHGPRTTIGRELQTNPFLLHTLRP